MIEIVRYTCQDKAELQKTQQASKMHSLFHYTYWSGSNCLMMPT